MFIVEARGIARLSNEDHSFLFLLKSPGRLSARRQRHRERVNMSAETENEGYEALKRRIPGDR